MLKTKQVIVRLPLMYFKKYNWQVLTYHKNICNFSSQQKLNNSEFSKQLGLDKQYQKVIKSQKDNQNSNFRGVSVLFLLGVVTVGGYILAKFVDKNESKIVAYNFRNFLSSFSLFGSQKQQTKTQRNIEHEQNLKQIFQNNYKDRSSIDLKYLYAIDSYLQNQIFKVKSQKLKHDDKNSTNKINKFGKNIGYLVDRICQKTMKKSQQQFKKPQLFFLSILQKILIRKLRMKQQATQQYLKQNQQYFTQNQYKNFSKCLLLKGDINQQILGYKLLTQTFPQKQLPNLRILFTQQQRKQIVQKICFNQMAIGKDVNVRQKVDKNGVSFNNNTAQFTQFTKDKYNYSVKQVQQALQIRKHKFKQFKNIINQFIVNLKPDDNVKASKSHK